MHAQESGASVGAMLTAIDILLEPDATMIARSETVNAELRKKFPNGFALDDQHRPHVTLVQRYARTAQLNSVYAAAERVIASARVTNLKMKAIKYYYIPSEKIGLAGIVIETTPDLLRLQQELIDANRRLLAAHATTSVTAGRSLVTRNRCSSLRRCRPLGVM